LLIRILCIPLALGATSVANADCTSTTHDFNDGTLQGWSQYGSFSLSNSGSAAYYSGNSGGCTLHGMYKDFDGGDSLSISYNYSAGSSHYGLVTNSYFSLRDASDSSQLYGEYAGYPRYGIGNGSGSYSNSWTTEIAGVATVRIVMGTYDCWSTNWSQWNQIDDVVVTVCVTDADGDGFDAIAEGGTDCDDNDATIYPGADETCDGVDNNCDGTVDEASAIDAGSWYADLDSDGFGDTTNTTLSCSQPTGYVADTSDCDDNDATINPSATEFCDSVDNNCDGTVDEDSASDASTWYTDSDSDGFGDNTSTTLSCNQPTGYVADATDCDDANATTYPGADEYCDGHDDNCDGDIDEDAAVDVLTWYADTDADGEGDPAVTDIDCYQPSGYVSNNTDCDDTTIVFNTADTDGDGFTSCGSDCNDTNADINVDANEIWYDGVDQNCDEASDYDQDTDGFDHIDYGGDDCDDENAEINVEATEIWYDGTDQDCDGQSDYDADTDGQDSESYGGEDCNDADPDTYTGAPDTPYDGIITDCSNANDYDADGDGALSTDYGGKDCDDANSDIHPNAEEIWYDGVDQDCDGNDDDQDGDSYSLENDCDDENEDLFENCDADSGSTDTAESDTGLSDDSDKESGCFSSSTGHKPVGYWALMLTGLLFFKRRR
jgi:hypothetical protein